MLEAWLEELTREECIDLLRADEVGRIGFVLDGSPVILPVNYRLVETATGPLLTLRTRPGGSIDRAPSEVAFEIDGIDHSHQRGWSVLVRGILRQFDAGDQEARLRLGNIPWLPADPDVWLVIEPVLVTGRRLQAAAVEWAFHANAYL